MKHFINLTIAVLILLNQAFYSLPLQSISNNVQITPTANPRETISATLTPVATETSSFGAYPPPIESTPTTNPTETPVIPTSTPSSTALPATLTPVPTSQPTTIPTEENPNLPPSIKLHKDTLTYTPGQSIDIQWKLENTKSSSVKSSWRIELILPMGWSPVNTTKGMFHPETQQLEIIPSSFSDILSIYTFEESGDQEIQATFFDNDVFLFNTSIFLRAKKTATVLKEGGEIEGKAGNTKIKVTFPKDALPSDSVISIQTPEKYPGTLPFNGKRVIELSAEDLKGNKYHKFNGVVQIEILYSPEEIGIHPSSMALYWFDEETGAWRVLPGEADRARNVFVAQTNHFSLFALGENSWESRKIPPLDVAQIASFTGSASYSIPIEVPNGPGGIKPSISIDYNSMSAEGLYFETPVDGYGAGITAGAQPSWVGTGWSLSSGGIVLRSMGEDTGWDGDDTFSLVVGGMSMKLVPVSEGSGYIDYKSSDENFWKIRRIKQQGTQNYSKVTYVNGTLQYQTLSARSEDDKWVVWDKSGIRFTFDKRAYYMEVLWDDSRLSEYNCGDGNRLCTDRPWGWFLTEIQYPSGQALTFTYDEDMANRDQKCFLWYDLVTGACAVLSYAQQAMYPLEIQYPDGKTKVTFVSEGRSDYIWYWGDTLSQNRYEKKRLSSIRVMVNATITREYKLNYFTSSENPLVPGSRWTPVDPLVNNNNKNYERILALKSVSQYGLGGISGGSKLPDITFSYSNQMFLTDVDNGQGGKASFNYEPIDPNANGGEGSPFTAAGGDPDQNKNLYQGGGFTLAVNENNYINPLPNGWDTSNGLPVRPGQGYRLTCTISGANGKVQFGMYYINEKAGVKTYSKEIDVVSNGSSYTTNIVIPVIYVDPVTGIIYGTNRATPAIKFSNDNGSGNRITVTNCSGLPVLTHYRATQRILSDSTTNVSYTYNYAYQGAATNDTAHSTNATLDATRRSGASVPYTEFRGHSKVIITHPSGLRTETSFYQDDINKGRISDSRQYNGSLLLNRTITHWIDTPIIISDGQVSNLCAKKTKNDACYLDQKVIWSYSDWDENRQYGQGVADENSNAYVGIHKIYQYASTTQYGNLIGVIEQTRSGSDWTSYRLTRTSYSANVVDGGTNPNGTKYLIELPGSINVYECTNGSCDEIAANLRKSSCYLYDDPINGDTGLCSVSFNGTTKVEVLDTPDSGLITGVRTLLHFGDGATADYTNPHYSDELYRYDSRGNRIRSTRFTGEGSKTTIASGVAQVTEACYGVGNQPAGCTDDGYYAYPRWEKNAMGQTTSWTIDYVLGVPTVETDSNGAIIYATYDAFGRMKALIQPGDDSHSPTISANYYDSSPSWIEVIPKNGATSRKIYDGLGRLIQSQQGNVTLTNGTRDVVVDYEYNALNQVTRQSVPVDITPYPYDGSAVYRKQTGSAAITNQYDPLGRLSLSTSTDATQVSYSYGIE
ncbi:MAG TPA: hypothetical protein VEA58_05925, partial [Anaerovoracaceae bacterium]|nr:hypothetical protein [Anaerovoracaceae bacterium]